MPAKKKKATTRRTAKKKKKLSKSADAIRMRKARRAKKQAAPAQTTTKTPKPSASAALATPSAATNPHQYPLSLDEEPEPVGFAVDSAIWSAIQAWLEHPTESPVPEKIMQMGIKRAADKLPMVAKAGVDASATVVTTDSDGRKTTVRVSTPVYMGDGSEIELSSLGSAPSDDD